MRGIQTLKMEREHRRFKWCGIGELYKEQIHEARDASTIVFCPKPCHSGLVARLENYPARNCFTSNTVSPLNEQSRISWLDAFLREDEDELDTSELCGFLCGSPPKRSTNPLVYDKLFAQKN